MLYHALNIKIKLNHQNSKQNGCHMQNKTIFKISIYDSLHLATAPKPCFLLPDSSLHSGTQDLTIETTLFALNAKRRANLRPANWTFSSRKPSLRVGLCHLPSTSVLQIYALLHSEHHGNFKSSKFKTKWPPHAKQGNIQDFYFLLAPSRHSAKTLLFTTRQFLALGDTRFNQ